MSEETKGAAPAELKLVRMKRQLSPCVFIRTFPVAGQEPIRRQIEAGQIVETDQKNAELVYAREPEHWLPIGWKPRAPEKVLEEEAAREQAEIAANRAPAVAQMTAEERKKFEEPIQI